VIVTFGLQFVSHPLMRELGRKWLNKDGGSARTMLAMPQSRVGLAAMCAGRGSDFELSNNDLQEGCKGRCWREPRGLAVCSDGATGWIAERLGVSQIHVVSALASDLLLTPSPNPISSCVQAFRPFEPLLTFPPR
jgi:hypothetical protein